MKKAKTIIALLVIFTYAALAIASGKSTSSAAKETANSSSANATVSESPRAQASETFALNETAVFNTLKITATDIKVSAGNDFMEPSSGNIFVGIKFTIENISSDDQTISSLLLFDPYVDDVKANLSISALTVFTKDANATTLDGTLSPGKKMIGYFGVEAPKDAKAIELDVKSSWLGSQKAVFVIDIPKK